MIRSEKQQYWKDRASRYSGFKWANDKAYLFLFIGSCDFKPQDQVLDVGCGPGIVSRAALPFVNCVIGLDSSKEMLDQCDGEIITGLGDVRDIPFPDQSFDKVLARNVFHHITDNLKRAFQECHRVLKPGGKLIIGERVPPSNSRQVHVEYREMLALKDKRHTFTEDNLRYFLVNTGFAPGPPIPVWIEGFSVREWLNGLTLDESTKFEIWNRHINGSEEFKEVSRMRFTEEKICDKKGKVDCLIDIKNMIIVGSAR